LTPPDLRRRLPLDVRLPDGVSKVAIHVKGQQGIIASIDQTTLS